jgi:hypothetical protein
MDAFPAKFGALMAAVALIVYVSFASEWHFGPGAASPSENAALAGTTLASWTVGHSLAHCRFPDGINSNLARNEFDLIIHESGAGALASDGRKSSVQLTCRVKPQATVASSDVTIDQLTLVVVSMQGIRQFPILVDKVREIRRTVCCLAFPVEITFVLRHPALVLHHLLSEMTKDWMIERLIRRMGQCPKKDGPYRLRPSWMTVSLAASLLFSGVGWPVSRNQCSIAC